MMARKSKISRAGSYVYDRVPLFMVSPILLQEWYNGTKLALYDFEIFDKLVVELGSSSVSLTLTAATYFFMSHTIGKAQKERQRELMANPRPPLPSLREKAQEFFWDTKRPMAARIFNTLANVSCVTALASLAGLAVDITTAVTTGTPSANSAPLMYTFFASLGAVPAFCALDKAVLFTHDERKKEVATRSELEERRDRVQQSFARDNLQTRINKLDFA